MRCKKAFTLIELLVVISIIALLLSILMPALSKVKRQAQKVVCKSNFKQIGIAVHLYANDNREYIPCYWTLNSQGEKEALATYGEWAGKDNTAESQGLGMLKVNGYIDTFDVLFCPSDMIRRPFRDEQIGLAPSLTDPAFEYISYWFHTIPAEGNTTGSTNMEARSRYRLNRRTQKARNPAIATDAGAWWTEWQGQELYPVHHSDMQGSGWNILYIDGTIGWRRLNKFIDKYGGDAAAWEPFLDYVDE